MLDTNTNLLTVKDLQKRFQIGRDRAYALMRTPGFPTIKIGRDYRVSEVKLEEWVDRYSNNRQFLLER